MASQTARSLRRPRAATKGDLNAYDATTTKQSQLDAQNQIERPQKRRLRRDSNAELPSDPNKRRRVETASPEPEIATKKPTRNTRTNRRSRSTSAKPFDLPEGEKNRTVSQSKVANGIKHELARLQPAATDTTAKDEKRKLRSVGRARFKSELATYFPDYDVVMGNEVAEPNLLNADTPILIIDSGPSMLKPTGRNSTSPTKRSRPSKPNASEVVEEPKYRQFSSDLFSELYQTHTVDLKLFDQLGRKGRSDPLPDDLYLRPHLREERAERGVKNQENQNSVHARNHIAQLLESLQGPDWLKVLGVGGVSTEGKKAEFEHAQQHYIKLCEKYLEKCRRWKEIEKRRKLEKERKASEIEEGDDSDGDPPDYSDVDHAAAMQLHEEAVKRSAPHVSRRRGRRVSFVEPPPQQKPEKPFTSFFAKPHLREAALTKRRRSGRSVLAFGHQIPEMLEREFELPEELRETAEKAGTPKRNIRRRRSSVIGSIVSKMTVPK